MKRLEDLYAKHFDNLNRDDEQRFILAIKDYTEQLISEIEELISEEKHLKITEDINQSSLLPIYYLTRITFGQTIVGLLKNKIKDRS